MLDPISNAKPFPFFRRFCRSEDGSFTLEAVIWMPIFAILLAITMNLSMVFYYESQMLRVAQDATRAFSLGRLTEEEAESYVQQSLAFIGANITVNTQQNGYIAQTIVSTNANELMPFSLMSGPFATVPVGVSTQYIIEF
ncbi:MAG: TadE/TadG family type IV pilus assembly protein [Roseobacter sp.]